MIFFFIVCRKHNPQSSGSTKPNPTQDTSPTSPQCDPQSPTNNTTNSSSPVSMAATQNCCPGPRPPDTGGPQSLETDGEMLPKYRRDLVAKQKILRAELNALQPQSGHCRLEVSRSEIFEVNQKLFLKIVFS